MDSIPWIYELSYMWKSLVLLAYQSEHSYRQDFMKAAQPQMDHKFPTNPYAISWDFPSLMVCPVTTTTKSSWEIILYMCLHTSFPKGGHPVSVTFSYWNSEVKKYSWRIYGQKIPHCCIVWAEVTFVSPQLISHRLISLLSSCELSLCL